MTPAETATLETPIETPIETPNEPMRTQEEIAARCEETSKMPFCFQPDVFLDFLDFDHARPFLKPEATREQWDVAPDPNAPPSPYPDREILVLGHPVPLTRENVLALMREYMAFAWEKVRHQRGISANRSVDKMTAWIWLLTDEEAMTAIEDLDYAPYGAPILRYICRRYGFDIPKGCE